MVHGGIQDNSDKTINVSINRQTCRRQSQSTGNRGSYRTEIEFFTLDG